MSKNIQRHKLDQQMISEAVRTIKPSVNVTLMDKGMWNTGMLMSVRLSDVGPCQMQLKEEGRKQ